MQAISFYDLFHLSFYMYSYASFCVFYSSLSDLTRYHDRMPFISLIMLTSTYVSLLTRCEWCQMLVFVAVSVVSFILRSDTCRGRKKQYPGSTDSDNNIRVQHQRFLGSDDKTKVRDPISTGFRHKACVQNPRSIHSIQQQSENCKIQCPQNLSPRTSRVSNSRERRRA